ncbi:hypothetical protein EDC02_2035 [Micromonospora sp. Llam0]|nr:hypothetical protein EDC02_2035 [Micromonospora sp. Llam0]
MGESPSKMLSQPLIATLLATTLVGTVAVASPGHAAAPPSGETIQTEVHDQVGRRLAGICVFATPYPIFEFPDFCPARSDPSGAVSVPVPGPGTYNLFALPDSGSRYGAQWVGQHGGTGTEKQARRITVTAGEAKQGPTIYLDRRAAITGMVTLGPIGNGTVGIVGPDPDGRRDPRYAPIATDGAFHIDWLGPYAWPLLFQADGYPYQWSGGVGNRLLAELVPATTTPSSTYWYPLRRGADVAVVVPDQPGPGRLVVRNVGTQDPVAVVDHDNWAEGKQFPLISRQQVTLRWEGGGIVRWYGGTDATDTVPVPVRDSGGLELVLAPG